MLCAWVMYSLGASIHSNRSKKNNFTRRCNSVNGDTVITLRSGKDKNGNDTAIASIEPKIPVFNPNARKMSYNRSLSHSPQPNYSQEHESLAKHLSASWQSVQKELDRKPADETGGPIYYIEKESNPNLSDFVPIDFDQWMAKRILHKVMQERSE